MNKKFSQQWLEIVCSLLPDAQSAMFMMPDRRSNQLRTLAKWPSNLKISSSYTSVVKYALKKRQQICFPKAIKSGQESFDVFALPIFIQSKLLGILIVKMKHQPEARHKAIFNSLKRSTKWLSLASPSQTQSDDFYSRVVALLASCFEQTSYQQGLISMVTELTRTFNCERVAFAEHKGHYSRVVALSNSASFDERSNLIQKIAEAMDESIEQDNAVLFPDPNTKLIQRAHQELARKFGIGSIFTLPLIHDNKIFGAISLLRNEGNPFDNQTLDLCQQTFSLITPYLALKREQERNLFYKIGTSIKQQMQNIFGVRHLKLKLASITAVFLIIMGSLIQGDFRVSADAVLEGKIQRVIAAPFSGYLLSASVSAGDIVQKDDIIASLNDSDILLQLTKLKGQLQKSRREYRQAQSTRDLVKVQIFNAQINQTRAEIKLAQQQLDRIHLSAPFDGVIIEGDLSQSLGSPVERGDTLFKIAPLEGYRIILKVNESNISYIKQSQTGTLILPSLSDRDFPLTIEKITVAAKADDGANIFRVEASLNDAADLLRPGMQGVGKINIGRARLIWIWTHEITDWLRLWIWSWWP